MSDGVPTHLRVAICQINTIVGDLDGNVALALEALAEAEEAGADVAVMPEMTITGYPPEDLVLKPGFVADCRVALEKFVAHTGRCAVVIGFADGDDAPGRVVQDVAGVDHFNGVWNAVAICAEGQVFGTYHKRHLPNYDVFDELRHFRPGAEALALYEIAGVPVGVTLCEDSWIPEGPVTQLARGGARLVLNVNGSPFREGKQQVREEVIAERVREAGVPVVYANLVGGQDELVFDGGSFVIAGDRDGTAVVARCNSFAAGTDVFDIELPAVQPTIDQYPIVSVTAAASGPRNLIPAPMVPPLDALAERWEALTLATRDYVRKSGFAKVCLGISGGVDSSLTAAIAVDALGRNNVHGILLPSRYSSDHSLDDAYALAKNLGIETSTIPIEPAHAALAEMLLPHVSDGAIEVGDLTDQNLQARIRGVVWMAMSNEHGWLALTAGNKSEAAVGYSTLYGDTAGAFAVIKDVWKLSVYELGRWRNQVAMMETGSVVIPEGVLTKAPSAELRPGQTDDQSLPPYEVLDPILKAYIEEDFTVAELIATEVAAPDVIERICRLVDIAEFKRRQTPLGARLTKKAFGRDRRMPIVNRYRG
ncbi:MAG: NAD+ synthase (glutamine-hydrolyzing) [Candidatus Aldehydirespiratoraceae bacterium]|jgi:NAD+ synthase (glutamine-hydrolysing)